MEPTLVAGRYRLLRRLGAGAMGAVYEALDVETERRRAVKVMHAHTLERADLRERFRLEAKVAGRVESPFLVDVLDAGVGEDGAPFLVMELLRGEDLRRRLDRVERFPPGEALRYVEQAARALDRVHAAGIVHRDLKPGNLFLEEREHEPGRVKVLDFGIAKLVETAAPAETTSSAGTPAYMAPEQFRGRGISAATDGYALGMIAFTFLVGAPYWEEERAKAGDIVGLALVAVKGPREPASARAARRGVELSPAFDAWFARATAVDPGRRFPSAGALARALAEALGLPSGMPAEEEARDVSGEDPGPGASPELATELLSDEGTRTEGTSPGSTTAPSSVQLVETRTDTGTRDAGRPPGARRPGRPAAARWAPAILLMGVAVLAFLRWPRSSPVSAVTAPPSPLAPPASVLGCPIFEASGVDEPSGWLGAAAATVLCERARILLGGATARTLIPAELLALPAQPVDRFPDDPYAAPDARARATDAARARAAAYADGRVVKDGAGFSVTVALRRPDGAEIDRAEGRGRALYEAVREAMTPLVARGAVPKASALDPGLSAFSRARDVDGALALLDLVLAMAHNAGELPAECARVQAKSADLGEMGPGERFRCAYALGLPAPAVELPPADPADPGAYAAWARVDYVVKSAGSAAVAGELGRLFTREQTPIGRSVLAATASCHLQSAAPDRALEMAILAVRAEPKNPVGENCAPWLQLATVSRGTPSAEAAVRGAQAWTPWDPYSWLLEAIGPGDAARAIGHARRAYALSPFDTYVADVLGDKLLASGAREEARGIGLALVEGGHPVHRVESDLLLLRVEASAARFGAALARAERAMVPSAGDAGYVRVTRLDLAWRALQIALVLGRASEIADLVVQRFLDPEPPPLDGAHIDVPLRLPAICAYASAGAQGRCFARFRALRDRLSGGILPETETFTLGAERYARGDLAGAARAFRPLLRQPDLFAAELAEPMIEAFERTGEADLVARLEAAVADRSAELNGASLSVVRAARRAERRGEREKAQALARRVVDAWGAADEPVPAVAEMRRLLGGAR